MPEQSAIEMLQQWEDAGSYWIAVDLSEERAVVELVTCSGEPVDRLETEDAATIAYVREREAQRAG